MTDPTDTTAQNQGPRQGKCGGYKCECPSYVKGETSTGWPSCARADCRHSQQVHARVDAAASQSVKRGAR